MAHTDYILRGSGYICPIAALLGSVTPGATSMFISSYTSQDGALPAANSIALINEEIILVTAATLDTLTIKRGVGDTIPQQHAAGSLIWFFDNNHIGGDRREYMATETIGLKVLMKTAGGAMQNENAPAKPLTFNSRFARPYPPGLVKMNANPFWYAEQRLETAGAINFNWAHRDRVTQADQRIDHSVASIGPEVGTSYVLRIYRANNTLLRTVSGLTGTSYNYTYSIAVGDFGHSPDDQPAYALLHSARGGYTAWQTYRMDFVFRSIVSDGFNRGFNRKFNF